MEEEEKELKDQVGHTKVIEEEGFKVGEKTNPREVAILEEIDTVKDLELSEVSPGKSSRSSNLSQRKLEFGQVSLLTKLRFSVLSPVEEQDKIAADHESEQEE